MKISTFNANSIRSRLDIVVKWLNDNEPDILCIQETKVVDEDFPALPFIEAGYNVVFRGEKSYNGVAIVSRMKLTNVRFGFDDGGPGDETRLACAKAGPVHVLNTYVPQGRDMEHPMYRYKLEWFGRLRKFIDRNFTARSKLVWVGDLNVAPLPIDIYDAKSHENHVCYHESVRRAFADVCEWGLVDVFRKHRPEPGQYSFFDYRMRDSVARGLGWRVDHILATPALAVKSTNAFIDMKPRLAEKPSDHTFVVAEFDV